MLGLGLQLNKIVNRAGGLPPLASLLTFFSKQRDDTTVINKLDSSGDTNGNIVGKKYYQSSRTNNTYVEFDMPERNYLNCTVKLSDVVVQISSTNNSLFGATCNNGKRYDVYFYSLSEFRIFYPTATGSSYKTYSLLSAGLSNGDVVDIDVMYGGLGDAPQLFIDGVEYDAGSATNLGAYTPNKLYFFTIAAGIGNATYASNMGLGGCKIYDENDELILNFEMSETGGVNSYETKTGLVGTIYNADADFFATDFTKAPYHILSGYSIIDGVVGEVPPLLGTQVDALNGDHLTNPAISNISNLGDGYYKLPSDIKVNELDLFNRADTTIYNTTCRSAEGYVSEDPYLWHVDELNTERILSYLKDAYKFTWFVKSTFTEGTYEPLTIKEIFAYSQKIEDADDLDKIKAYIGYNWS